MGGADHRAGPRLSDATTRAIADAVFVELAATGFDRLSIEAVARRAGVGKAAIYRRWTGKREMVMDLVTSRATQAQLFPDSGSLRSDLDLMLAGLEGYLRHPLIARIAPDLLAVGARDGSFARELYDRGGAIRRDHAIAMLERAVRRGELPPGLDREFGADIVIAPLYWRLSVTRQPHSARDRARLIVATIAALRASDDSGVASI